LKYRGLWWKNWLWGVKLYALSTFVVKLPPCFCQFGQMRIMPLFTNKLSQRIEKTGSTHVKRLAKDPERESLRADLETKFALLPSISQKRLEKRFYNLVGDGPQFWQTISEMVVGSFFVGQKYNVEYGCEIEGLTPDWIVESKEDGKFIVEVTTRNVSDEELSQKESIGRLNDCLDDLRYSALLDVSYINEKICVHLSNETILQMGDSINNWLKTNLSIGEKRVFSNENIVVVYGGTNQPFDWIQVVGATRSLVPDHIAVENAIIKKIKKYGPVLMKLQVPFVIALNCDFQTGMGFNEVQYILLDRPQPLFRDQPLLSSYLHYDFQLQGRWQYKMVRNPYASYPLQSDEFQDISLN
jgi:hypothetical protein